MRRRADVAPVAVLRGIGLGSTAARTLRQLEENGMSAQLHPAPVRKPENQGSSNSPVLDANAHAAILAEALRVATKLGRVDVVGPRALQEPVNGVYSLARWQSGFKKQNDRGTCWAFAGA